MTDKQIQERVFGELDKEQLVSSTEIGVSVKDGVVALSGYVESPNQKHRAELAARRVYGVLAVADDLEVRLPTDREQPDPRIASEAVCALAMYNTVLPTHQIQVIVSEGRLSLQGEVDWIHQRETAEAVVRDLPGVKSVSNQITLRPRVSSANVKVGIEAALRRGVDLGACKIEVETVNSTVVLHRSVGDWQEREEAERLAWGTPGVARVENHLAVPACA